MSRPRARIRGLLLEEAPEGPARLVGMDRPGGGVTLDRDHHREQRALVAGTLVCDPLGNPLPALETGGRIEVGALGGGVQLAAAVRALGEGVGGDRQPRAALGAARGRAALEDAKRALRLGRLGRLAPVLAAAAGTPVTLLPISTVAHHATPAAAGGTSCTSSRSRSSRGRCARSSRRSVYAAPARAGVPRAARILAATASTLLGAARPAWRRATPERPPTR